MFSGDGRVGAPGHATAPRHRQGLKWTSNSPESSASSRHLCLEVVDIAAEYERLRTAGMSFHAPPPEVASNGLKAVYARDPEGNVIELLEFTDT